MAAVMGPCMGADGYLVIMSDKSHIVEGTGSIFLAGSHLVKAAIGKQIDNEAPGRGFVRVDTAAFDDNWRRAAQQSTSKCLFEGEENSPYAFSFW
jgi:3-methylcrotonyl-CoA carboxylase beta subunit